MVTGSAGFIGFHVARALLAEGHQVIGLDSHNDYYDPRLKADREAILLAMPGYEAVRGKVEEPGLLHGVFERHRPEGVVHLAAQAGVRHSIKNPRAYVEANLLGGFELLEAARAFPPRHLMMASTSSVYGANTKMPYAETDKTEAPLSFYAATKKSNEVMAHSYAHLFDLPITMFRFFTVFGPWGRPDMAPHLFTDAILNDRPIKVFNHGDMRRDFTYIDDLVAGILALLPHPPSVALPEGDSLSPVAPWRSINIGNGEPVKLMDFIAALETAIGSDARKQMMPMQPGDVSATWADDTLITRLTGGVPKTPLPDAVQAYVTWFRGYFECALSPAESPAAGE
nr:NAD-dependent epimerase/dehydratase family protein [Paracoccus sp. C2R09]